MSFTESDTLDRMAQSSPQDAVATLWCTDATSAVSGRTRERKKVRTRDV